MDFTKSQLQLTNTFALENLQKSIGELNNDLIEFKEQKNNLQLNDQIIDLRNKINHSRLMFERIKTRVELLKKLNSQKN